MAAAVYLVAFALAVLLDQLDELREEIGQITNVINANQKQLDTYVAAFNWYSQQLEAVHAEQQ